MRRFGMILTLMMLLLGPAGLAWSAGQANAAPAARPEMGADLYQRLSCRGCHVLAGQGGEAGPVLDGVGGRLSREELEIQLLTPRRRRADSRMPSFAFVRPVELQALLDFLQAR